MTKRSHRHVGISQGQTVGDIYWTVPGHYWVGDRYESRVGALRAAIEGREVLVADNSYIPETVTVDERWSMVGDSGNVQLDFVIHRETIPTLREAKELLKLAEKYGGTA